jgi:hypothetical protein
MTTDYSGSASFSYYSTDYSLAFFYSQQPQVTQSDFFAVRRRDRSRAAPVPDHRADAGLPIT